MTSIRAHISTNHRVVFIGKCKMYRASISLNGQEYARVRLTEEEAVEALIKHCEKTFVQPEEVEAGIVESNTWHRWKRNICIRCGISRKRKNWKILTPLKTSSSWWYGEEYKFQRPNCKSKISNNETIQIQSVE
jgi:hypothetical protein